MLTYKAPIRDMTFVLNNVLALDAHYQKLGMTDMGTDFVVTLLDASAKFAEQVLHPLNRSGDEEGCHFDEGAVTTPTGFIDAYQQFVEAGWPALEGCTEYGGQGLPASAGIGVTEINGTANWAFSMYPGLSHGAVATIEHHGTDEQKQLFLPKLISGQWTGTMCLTESHCGSDLGLLKTKAVPKEAGCYAITGTKIFISAGEHDLTENIIHIVLARLEGAPEGTAGISLFIVPKVKVDAKGQLLTNNRVSCGSIEHKMGIKASATCVMHFDEAEGFLIGEANKGLQSMFTFMNFARLGTAVQGLAAAESAFQGAYSYAKERQAMRALSGAKCPDQPADPIIVHPDVRRMLLTQKAFAEGGRALIYFAAMQGDIVRFGQPKEAQAAEEMMAFLTPIAKAFLTEVGCEAANYGIQVYGGHGYIREWGMEQIVRDARIATLYEGTTGIQALDLLGRKVLMSRGESLKQFTKFVHCFCRAHADEPKLAQFVRPLAKLNQQWGELTQKLGMKALMNRDEVGAAAVDYLMYSGYVTLAYFWAVMAEKAQLALTEGTDDIRFYEAKLTTARFYYARILPRAEMHVQVMQADIETLLDLNEADFKF